MDATLQPHARNITSYRGEDGIIGHIFSVIGTTNAWCLELGAANPGKGSNTYNLIQQGWSALLIEADPTHSQKLRSVYSDNDRVLCGNRFISFQGRETLDAILPETPIPSDFDLFVLDVDGNEYHIWGSLKQYRPRVVMVEFNFTIPNDIEFINPRDIAIQQGSSLRSLDQLARSKGYRLIGTTTANAFFVFNEIFPLFNISDASLDALHPDKTYHTRMFQLYDGTLVLTGYSELFWHKRPIPREAIQVLPSWRRRAPTRVNSSSRIRQLKSWVRAIPVLYPIYLKLKLILGLRSD